MVNDSGDDPMHVDIDDPNGGGNQQRPAAVKRRDVNFNHDQDFIDLVSDSDDNAADDDDQGNRRLVEWRVATPEHVPSFWSDDDEEYGGEQDEPHREQILPKSASEESHGTNSVNATVNQLPPSISTEEQNHGHSPVHLPSTSTGISNFYYNYVFLFLLLSTQIRPYLFDREETIANKTI